MAFETWDWRKIDTDVFSLIADDWMLITAGSPAQWNTMTASWGGFGHLWNRDVAFVFVRPTRHTFGFMEKSAGFSLSFLAREHRKALEVCGSVSGRDVDKAEAAGLHPRGLTGGAADLGRPATGSAAGGGEWLGFDEARIVLGCRKIHAQDLDPKGFIDPAIATNYQAKDWHRLYVGAIEAAWRQD